MAVERQAAIEAYAAQMDGLKGWFHHIDLVVMELVDRAQAALGIRGDILEIGCYEGKSAVLLGWFLRDGETLTVCDPFDDESAAGADRDEVDALYPDVSMKAFLASFSRFHRFLPTVLACRSTDGAVAELPPRFRMVHVDGSHRYDNVRADIGTSRRLLVPNGVVVLDDFRYWVDVSCAVWRAVARDGLRPVAATEHKLYGTFGASPAAVSAVQGAIVDQLGVEASVHVLEGEPVVVVGEGAGPRP